MFEGDSSLYFTVHFEMVSETPSRKSILPNHSTNHCLLVFIMIHAFYLTANNNCLLVFVRTHSNAQGANQGKT